MIFFVMIILANQIERWRCIFLAPVTILANLVTAASWTDHVRSPLRRNDNTCTSFRNQSVRTQTSASRIKLITPVPYQAADICFTLPREGCTGNVALRFLLLVEEFNLSNTTGESRYKTPRTAAGWNKSNAQYLRLLLCCKERKRRLAYNSPLGDVES